MKAEKVLKSSQEQAVAAWIGLINQMRIDDLVENLSRQDQNLDSAMESMDWALGKIEGLVVANRGGNKGIHGFIAEVAECGLENAQNLVHGNKPVMEWVNDNGPADPFAQRRRDTGQIRKRRRQVLPGRSCPPIWRNTPISSTKTVSTRSRRTISTRCAPCTR